MKICKAIHSTFCKFANVTTIHGLAYVFDKTIKAIDYVFLFIVVCLGSGLAIYSSFDAWKECKASPVLTSIRSTGLPLQNISFPAITICSQGLIKVSFSGFLLNQISSFLRNFKDENISKDEPHANGKQMMLICTWLLKNKVWKIKLDNLIFVLFQTGISRLHRQ